MRTTRYHSIYIFRTYTYNISILLMICVMVSTVEFVFDSLPSSVRFFWKEEILRDTSFDPRGDFDHLQSGVTGKFLSPTFETTYR